jgi:hypothetical protein
MKANRCPTIAPLVACDGHWILPTNHGTMHPHHILSVPPPLADKSMILPLPTTSTKLKNMKHAEHNIGWYLRDLADNGPQHGTGNLTKQDTSMVPPALLHKQTSMTLIPAIKNHPRTTPPASSVSDSSSPGVQFQCKVGTWVIFFDMVLSHDNQDRCNLAGFTTKNTKLKCPNLACNQLYEFCSYRNMINT